MQRRHSEVSIPPFLLPFVRPSNNVDSTTNLLTIPHLKFQRHALNKIIVTHERCIVIPSYCTLIDVPVSECPPQYTYNP